MSTEPSFEQIAHELRNPIFAITSMLDALKAEPDPAAALPGYLPHLREAGKRVEQLLRELDALPARTGR